jgi:Glycosyl transferase family 2
MLWCCTTFQRTTWPLVYRLAADRDFEMRSMLPDESLGAVVIGRNEGHRLQACLGSVLPGIASVVYVDSGSTDGSVELARGMGAEVIQLDMARPFTAARARNTGFSHLMARHHHTRYVQFIDGDCELVDGWLGVALQHLESHPDSAVVSGTPSGLSSIACATASGTPRWVTP